MIRRPGYGLIGMMGALAMMNGGRRALTFAVKPIAPPIEPLQAPEPRPAVGAEPLRLREPMDGDNRAMAAAQDKRHRRAEKRKKQRGRMSNVPWTPGPQPAKEG